MTYDIKKHITHAEFAEELGVDLGALTRRLKKDVGPEPVLVTRKDKGTRKRYYDRAEAMRWIAEITNPKTPERSGIIVPARKPVPLAEQGTYRPSAQMSINQQRAAELYPHSLITPKGIGNEREFGLNFDRR